MQRWWNEAQCSKKKQDHTPHSMGIPHRITSPLRWSSLLLFLMLCLFYTKAYTQHYYKYESQFSNLTTHATPMLHMSHQTSLSYIILLHIYYIHHTNPIINSVKNKCIYSSQKQQEIHVEMERCSHEQQHWNGQSDRQRIIYYCIYIYFIYLFYIPYI